MAHRARSSARRHADYRSGRSRRFGKQAARKGRRTATSFVTRPLRALTSVGPFLLFGLALVTTGLVVALAARHVAVGRAAMSAITGPQRTGRASTAPVAAGAAGMTWIPLRSQAPGDILAAARQSPLFQAHRADEGDHEQDLSRLGQPVLVHAVQPSNRTSAYAWPDVYVLPILDAAGNTVAAAEVELNPAHTAVHVTSIVTYAQPRPHGSIARQSSATAVSTLAAQQHVALRLDTTPQLVYFPLDARFQNAGSAGSGAWTAGGTFPADPAWLVMGADGLQRLVGTDNSVYLVSQLPMSQG
jgi:hypothetical protein